MRPPHSAIKIDGERLYEKARRGEEVEKRLRSVTISEFEITNIALPEVAFRVVCSKGTYIRSLIHDFGAALNNGAYLSALRRTSRDVRFLGSFPRADAEATVVTGGTGDVDYRDAAAWLAGVRSGT